MLHFDAKTGNALVVQRINRGERPISGRLLRLLNRHARWGKPLEPAILPQGTAGGKPQLLLVSNGFVVFFPFIGITEIAHLAPPVRDNQVLDRMGLFLAAVVRFAVGFVFGAINSPFRAINEKLSARTGAENLLQISRVSLR